jgi:uncharacterized protein (TIRG00374 family)
VEIAALIKHAVSGGKTSHFTGLHATMRAARRNRPRVTLASSFRESGVAPRATYSNAQNIIDSMERFPMLRYLILITKVALSAGLVWYAFSKVDVGSALDYLRNISAQVIVLVLFLLFVQMVIAASRLRELLMLLGARCSLIGAVDVVMIGAFFSQTMISFIGGDAMRIWRIVRSRTSVGVATKSILFDRAAGFAGLILLAFFGLPFLMQLIEQPELKISLLIAMFAFVLGFLFFLSLRHMPAIFMKWRAFNMIADFSSEARKLSRNKRGATTLLVLSLAIHVMNVVILYIIAQSLSIEITFLNSIVLFPPVLFMSMLPISVAGWGVREGAMVVALNMVDVSSHQSLALSICFGLCALAISLPGGALWFYTRSHGASGMPVAETAAPKKD